MAKLAASLQQKSEQKRKKEALLQDPLPGAEDLGKEETQNKQTRAEKKEGWEDGGSWGVHLLLIVTLISFATRFYRLDYPNQLVFDEVHFGKFASFYLRHRFFFDVHPPFGKLLVALGAYLAGFDGHFDFHHIGEVFPPEVPYVALRMVAAIPGALIPPLCFLILKALGHSNSASFLAGMMVALDNAMTIQSRVFLLDTPMMFFILMSFYSWIRFLKCRSRSFSAAWWVWLILTGIFLIFSTSIKFVGIFMVAIIGFETLLDLWHLLDIRQGLSLDQVFVHFSARFMCLVVSPMLIYLLIYYVHFSLLTKSGPGDTVMSLGFQASLEMNPVVSSPQFIAYGSLVTLRHATTLGYLSSLEVQYPHKYPDGRISSKCQAVFATITEGTQSWWIVLPEDEYLDYFENPVFVKNGDQIRLQHQETGAFLYTHDVASTLMAGYMEVCGDSPKVSMFKGKGGGSVWRVEIEGGIPTTTLETLTSVFRLNHVGTGGYLHSHPGKLPEWAFNYQEVNGSKNKTNQNNWSIQTHKNRNLTQYIRTTKPLGFWDKFLEIHEKMIFLNSQLQGGHYFESHPASWPFVIRGIRFWDTPHRKNEQIYLLGNPFVWGCAFYCGIVMFLIISITVVLREKRGIYDFRQENRNRFFRSGLLLFACYLLHYIPFFFMERVLFMHHYLPAFLFSVLLTGVVFDFICERFDDEEASMSSLLILCAIFSVGFYLFLPLTYGFGATYEQMRLIHWMKTWDFAVHQN